MSTQNNNIVQIKDNIVDKLDKLKICKTNIINSIRRKGVIIDSNEDKFSYIPEYIDQIKGIYNILNNINLDDFNIKADNPIVSYSGSVLHIVGNYVATRELILVFSYAFGLSYGNVYPTEAQFIKLTKTKLNGEQVVILNNVGLGVETRMNGLGFIHLEPGDTLTWETNGNNAADWYWLIYTALTIEAFYKNNENENHDIIIHTAYKQMIRSLNLNNSEPLTAGAFYNCGNLTEIVPTTQITNITEIPPSCFYGCTNLGFIQGLTWNTRSLSGYYSNITSIGEYAFYGCQWSNSTNYRLLPINLKTIKAHAFENCKPHYSWPFLNISALNQLTSIGDAAFKDIHLYGARACNWDNFRLPPNLKHIGASAFYNCYDIDRSNSGGYFLRSLSSCTSLSSIGEYAFWNCQYTKLATIPASVKIISKFSFAYNVRIPTIYIYAKLNKIEEGVFDQCNSLTYLRFYNHTVNDKIFYINDTYYSFSELISSSTNYLINKFITKFSTKAIQMFWSDGVKHHLYFTAQGVFKSYA